MTLSPHPIPPRPPAPRARILVMVSKSNVHAEVYAKGRWRGIAETYTVPAKKLGYAGAVVRFPATKLGDAWPRDAMSVPEIGYFTEASLMGVPFILYMLPPPLPEPTSWMRRYFPLSVLTLYDQSSGLNVRQPNIWKAMVSFHYAARHLGIEPIPDINIPEQHKYPSIIWWSLLQTNNPAWLPVARRQAEMMVVLDLPNPTRESIIAEARRLSALGYSPVIMADHATGWNIAAKELLA